MKTISASHFDFLGTTRLSRLRSSGILQTSVCRDATLSSFAAIEIDVPNALAVISILNAEGLGKAHLLIYHRGCKGSIDRRPFGSGFPELPYACPVCNEEQTSYSSLEFDVGITIPESVKVV